MNLRINSIEIPAASLEVCFPTTQRLAERVNSTFHVTSTKEVHWDQVRRPGDGGGALAKSRPIHRPGNWTFKKDLGSA